MTERQLSKAVVELATRIGWRVHTLSDSRSLRSHHPGFPDLFMVRGPRMVAAELKSATGRFRAGQHEWLVALETAGAEVYLWRPKDWCDGSIERCLRGAQR